jgi:hypothetical protein
MRGPFRGLGRLEQEIEDVFGRLFRDWPFPRLFGEARGVAPAVDMLDRKGEKEAREEDFYCCERWAGSFERSLTLPPGVDAGKVKATFKQGVLEVRLPKVEKAKGKKVEIKLE